MAAIMHLAAKVFKIAGTMLLYIFVFDVVGVVISFILDVIFTLPVRGASAAAFYALWFVLGVFCGLFSYNTASAKVSPKTDAATGRLVCAVSILVLAGLGVLFGFLFWGSSTEGNYFVPDNVPLTMTFFVGIAGGTVVAHNAQS